MPQQITEFWATATTQEQMLKEHNVSLEEVEEAAMSSPVYQRQKSIGSEKRYVVPGKTSAGRRLWVIFADEGGGRGRIISARETKGRKERARHKRMRGE